MNECVHEYRQLYTYWMSHRLKPNGFFCIKCLKEVKNETKRLGN